jgi:hypothetical protein
VSSRAPSAPSDLRDSEIKYPPPPVSSMPRAPRAPVPRKVLTDPLPPY